MLTATYAESRIKATYAECLYAECRYAECRYAETRAVLLLSRTLDLGVIRRVFYQYATAGGHLITFLRPTC
jgi:hypothetical protein